MEFKNSIRLKDIINQYIEKVDDVKIPILMIGSDGTIVPDIKVQEKQEWDFAGHFDFELTRESPEDIEIYIDDTKLYNESYIIHSSMFPYITYKTDVNNRDVKYITFKTVTLQNQAQLLLNQLSYYEMWKEKDKWGFYFHEALSNKHKYEIMSRKNAKQMIKALNKKYIWEYIPFEKSTRMKESQKIKSYVISNPSDTILDSVLIKQNCYLTYYDVNTDRYYLFIQNEKIIPILNKICNIDILVGNADDLLKNLFIKTLNNLKQNKIILIES